MDRDIKKRLIADSKPDEPIGPGDRRHFDFDTPELRLRGSPWRERLASVIDLAAGPTAQLVTGLRGSGKTTELQQLEGVLRNQGCHVVMADVGQWISDERPILSEDLLLAAVLAIYPEGDPASLSGWARESGERIKQFFKSRVELEGAALGLKARLTSDQTLFQRVAKRLREADGVREEVHGLLAHAAEALERDEQQKLVIVLDGAEKRATGDLHGPEKRAEFHNHWFGAFILTGRDLRLPVHVVYTVPPFMIRRASEIAAQFGVELEFLPMIRVFGHDAEINPAGVRGLVDALHLRVDASLFEDPAIARWLALRSGGYFRDLLRFVTEMTYQVEDAPKFTRAHAEAAVQKIGQSYREGLVLEEQEVLRSLRPSRRFPEQERLLTRIDALLQGFKMFRYHNSTPWYDAHPLLWHDLGFDEASWAEVERLS